MWVLRPQRDLVNADRAAIKRLRLCVIRPRLEVKGILIEEETGFFSGIAFVRRMSKRGDGVRLKKAAARP